MSLTKIGKYMVGKVFTHFRRLFDKYPVTRTEHEALVKSATKFFSNFVAFSENLRLEPTFN